jgi:hypothetical protein
MTGFPPKVVGPLVLIAAVGCDRERPPQTQWLSGVLAACEAPTLEDPVECEAPEPLEPDGEVTIDSGLSVPLRHPDSLVRAADLTVAVGRYGAAATEGAWIAAIDSSGAVAWSASVEDASPIHPAFAVGDATGVWLVAAVGDGSTFARRYDLAGVVVGERLIPDFDGTSGIAQPDGGIAITGIAAGGDPGYVGVDATGSEVFNDDENQAVGPYLVANGTVALFDGPGDATWELDPRGTPDRGFPIDVGVEYAMFSLLGDVLAIGTTLGPLGDATLLIRVSPEGEQVWSQSIRRSHALALLEGAMDTVVIVGDSYHCRPGTYLSVFDAGAVVLQENILAAPPAPWTIAVDASLAGVTVDGTDLILRTYGLEVPPPK